MFKILPKVTGSMGARALLFSAAALLSIQLGLAAFCNDAQNRCSTYTLKESDSSCDSVDVLHRGLVPTPGALELGVRTLVKSQEGSHEAGLHVGSCGMVSRAADHHRMCLGLTWLT